MAAPTRYAASFRRAACSAAADGYKERTASDKRVDWHIPNRPAVCRSHARLLNCATMNPIRRELLNGLLVLVTASLLSVAFSAFQVSFNAQLWVLILMGIAIAVSCYIMFEIALRYMASSEARETEWLKRVGTPARLEVNQEEANSGIASAAEAVKAMSPGGDFIVMHYVSSEGGTESPLLKEANAVRERIFSVALERLKLGTLREYKRIICFEHNVLASDHELKSGVLRVGEGPGTIDRRMAEHCRVMTETKGCSLYVAPAVLRSSIALYGSNKIVFTVEAAEQITGGRRQAGFIFFSDPPNAEIIEQFRQIERETERRMVAVHKIIFPEDAEPTERLATR